MKIIKIVGSIVAGILLIIALAIYFLPTTAHMERTKVVNATPEEIYRDLITFRNFNTWSPWAEKDLNADYIYEGPEFGVGARITWKSSDPDLGNGSMEIVEAIPDKQVTSVLRFDEYDSNPYGTFTLEKQGDATQVTWSYDEYDINGFAKIFMLGIDGFLGRDWEIALERLKRRVEAAPKFNFDISLKTATSYKYLGLKDSALNDPAMISVKMAQSYGELMNFLSQNRLEPGGHPIAVFTNENDYEVSFICGIPIVSMFDPVSEFNRKDERYPMYDSYEGLVVQAVYRGDYSGLERAHEEVRKFASFYNYIISGNPWEEYVTDPDENPDATQWETNIYYPVQ